MLEMSYESLFIHLCGYILLQDAYLTFDTFNCLIVCVCVLWLFLYIVIT